MLQQFFSQRRNVAVVLTVLATLVWFCTLSFYRSAPARPVIDSLSRETTVSLGIDSCPMWEGRWDDLDGISDEKFLDRVPPPATFDRHDGSKPQILRDAHRLKSADDFLDHFAAVTTSKGLTFAEAEAGCTWGKDEYVNFMFGPDKWWVVNTTSDTLIDARRRHLHYWVQHKMLAWKGFQHRFSGRGIVIVGGNDNTLERAKVSLRALMKLNSRLPVEIHYWDGEIAAEKQRELEDLYYPNMLFFNDLSGDSNIAHVGHNEKGHNYGFKTAALVNSRFAEMLLLDADNIPIIRPEELFDSQTYEEYGTVAWPDITRTRPQSPAWAITNTVCKMDAYELESGQMLMDKRRYWYHLQLAAWMNNQQGRFYNAYILGDKDMFRFAWYALQTDYGRPTTWLTSVGTSHWTGEHQKYCGHTFAQHHPDGGDAPVAFMHGGYLKMFYPELLLFNKERGGIAKYYKRSPSDTDPSYNTHVRFRIDTAEYMPNKTETFTSPWCTDIEDVEERDSKELIPGFEQFFIDVGGYWLLDRPDLKPPY